MNVWQSWEHRDENDDAWMWEVTISDKCMSAGFKEKCSVGNQVRRRNRDDLGLWSGRPMRIGLLQTERRNYTN